MAAAIMEEQYTEIAALIHNRIVPECYNPQSIEQFGPDQTRHFQAEQNVGPDFGPNY